MDGGWPPSFGLPGRNPSDWVAVIVGIRSMARRYRNVLTLVPRGKARDVAALLKAIDGQEDREARFFRRGDCMPNECRHPRPPWGPLSIDFLTPY